VEKLDLDTPTASAVYSPIDKVDMTGLLDAIAD
jgi:hypothetical protein